MKSSLPSDVEIDFVHKNDRILGYVREQARKALSDETQQISSPSRSNSSNKENAKQVTQ